MKSSFLFLMAFFLPLSALACGGATTTRSVNLTSADIPAEATSRDPLTLTFTTSACSYTVTDNDGLALVASVFKIIWDQGRQTGGQTFSVSQNNIREALRRGYARFLEQVKRPATAEQERIRRLQSEAAAANPQLAELIAGSPLIEAEALKPFVEALVSGQEMSREQFGQFGRALGRISDRRVYPVAGECSIGENPDPESRIREILGIGGRSLSDGFDINYRPPQLRGSGCGRVISDSGSSTLELLGSGVRRTRTPGARTN